MDGEALYDEFGNYIGPDLDESSSDESSEEEATPVQRSAWEEDEDGDAEMEASGVNASSAAAAGAAANAGAGVEERSIVLHEDKEYFDPAEALFQGAEILVEEEDTQPIETPIIAPVTVKTFMLSETVRTSPDDEATAAVPPSQVTTVGFDFRFLGSLMDHPKFTRCVTVAGHLHHGKTLLVDLLVKATHQLPAKSLGSNTGETGHSRNLNNHSTLRFTDNRLDERRRGISLKAKPVSLVCPTLLRPKSHLLNVFDTPGHVNFSDEVTAAMAASDGCVLVVDVVEGVLMQTERTLRQAVALGQRVVLVLTKVDRLILELKLPPNDAYFKLVHTIDNVNGLLRAAGSDQRLTPSRGTVAFASGLHEWCFTLPSFAQRYIEQQGLPGGKSNVLGLAKRLWGDSYFNPETRRFQRQASHGQSRAFVEFVLTPVYKIYSTVLSNTGKPLQALCERLGIRVSGTELAQDVAPLLRTILSRYFSQSAAALTEMLVTHLPSPVEAARARVERWYSGPLNSPLAQSMIACDSSPDAPVMVHVMKLFPRPDGSRFDAFGRVYSGSLKVGDQVRVLGEGYTLEDDEDMRVATVSRIWVFETRYRVEMNRVGAGNWALFEGVDTSIAKTATLAGMPSTAKGKANKVALEDAEIFRPLQFDTVSAMKIAIEPLNPSELPKMLEGLRRVSKSYPMLATKAEESGEHVVLGTGELYLDACLYDLRRMYADMEVRVADPAVSFAETVTETSSLQCVARTPNQKNKLTMIANPLDPLIAEDIEARVVSTNPNDMSPTDLSSAFRERYDWDVLAARSIWSFGPDDYGPNILLDDTLASSEAVLGGNAEAEEAKRLLYSTKRSIIQGFQWAVREGPLCDEPIRNVCFKLLDAELAPVAMQRAPGQIIPTARRVAYSAFLLGRPRLLEPIYRVEVLAPADCIGPISKIVRPRRGRVTKSEPKPGTPLFQMEIFLPLIDSFGFETDLRTHTQGQAYGMSVFSHWDVVPGDPLRKDIVLRPLEPAPREVLARDFMVKTRRRKGFPEDVSVHRYFEEGMLLELAKQDAELNAMLDE